jgi:hypothetical protein
MNKWVEEDEISMSKSRPQEFTPPSARASLVPRKVASYEKRGSSSAAGARKPTTGLKIDVLQIDGLQEDLQIDGLLADVVDSDGKPHPAGTTPLKPASIFQPHEALSPREGFQVKLFHILEAWLRTHSDRMSKNEFHIISCTEKNRVKPNQVLSGLIALVSKHARFLVCYY